MEESINSYYSLNNNKLLNNKQFIERLYTNITGQLKRPLDAGEKKFLQDMLRQEIPVKFRNKTPNEILHIYTTSLINRFKKNSCTYDRIDMHEVNKSQMGLDSEISSEDFSQNAAQKYASQVVNPQQQISLLPKGGVKQEYIMLDTRYRSLDNDGSLYFRWNAIYDNSSIQGGFNINQKVRDIVAIKCYPIKLPYIATADNDYGRATLLIQEFQSQSFVAHENTRFHYMFATDVEDRWIHLRVHNYNEGVFRFATPITQISSLTISLSAPLQPLIFDQDRMTMFISDYTTNKKTYFNAAGNHNLETGDLVYISGFTTANPSSNAPTIGAINNVYGNKITYVDNTTFYVDVDSTLIYQQGAGTATATNGSNIITGAGTNFVQLFKQGDNISVNGVQLTVSAITSGTSLTTTTNYTGITGAYIYYLDNRISGLQTNVYFGSKRVLMCFELTYIESGMS